MGSVIFDRTHRASYGVLETVAPRLRRITANNPSSLTYLGTETYVIGEGEVAVVDPGPADVQHISDLLTALKSETITHILLTHTHSDHCSGCAFLQNEISAPVFGIQLDVTGLTEDSGASSESADMDFVMDECVLPGDSISGRDWSVDCLFTPGHMLNHVCFSIVGENDLISGDHVMGWSTSIVSPPQGHMGSYMKSLELMLTRAEQTYWPGHGGPVRNPHEYVRSLIEHRRQRERVILNSLDNGYATINRLVPVVYPDIAQSLYSAAAQNLYATLIHLVEQGRVDCKGPLTKHAEFSLA